MDGDTTMMVTELMDTDLYRALQVGAALFPLWMNRLGHTIDPAAWAACVAVRGAARVM